nr:TonB family protein [Deltaproteobacteria bacterium]
ASPSSAPVVAAPRPPTGGPGDQDIIRRVVRARIGEVRACYNEGLEEDPTLQGRVVVQFTVASDGHVPGATITETTMPDTPVGPCIVRAVEKWRFPKPPNGGNAVVTFPFVLVPE